MFGLLSLLRFGGGDFSFRGVGEKVGWIKSATIFGRGRGLNGRLAVLKKRLKKVFAPKARFLGLLKAFLRRHVLNLQI
jgi:hypothetical protein